MRLAFYGLTPFFETAGEKRVWLERASSYLRPAVAAGRLTRDEREVLPARID
jgi:hypothetical protein